ncbi:helix-turn-helix domain-containing protein [Pseudooceanicola sp. CBS1P-1]|uniref:MerR family transcriptional regulator n=1 Tax=Pseudooceanicola albus TaxID=2692189 RepID=A0A6L7FY11_9RHOB|nr:MULTISPECIES: helix-turn-helix domain-containing protein [Pseudooceanicola]MBT9384019.1 helix-turn-helix domain-containing protein [Pseudooceanicola endophyticus]MXN16569.1 MerR family transcriptional regulator [Pseudooceanicola albus]
MFSIGELSRATGVKVPTIRYYEGAGLLAPEERTEGNQRRYGRAGLERLQFIAHGRELGLSLEAIRHLLELSDRGRDCTDAHLIARRHLEETRARIARLQRLETELARLSEVCDHGPGEPCGLIAALGDHGQCLGEH